MCSFPVSSFPPPYPPPLAGEGREGAVGSRRCEMRIRLLKSIGASARLYAGTRSHPATKDTAADSLGAEEDPLQ